MTPYVLSRFLAKLAPDETPDGCVIWIGSRTTKGYGQLWDGSRLVHAHRLAYEHYVGPIDPGNIIDHRCRNRACVAAQHLEQVTPAENMRRGLHGVLRTMCNKGLHPWVPGQLRCMSCRRAYARAYMRAWRLKEVKPNGSQSG